MSWSLSAQECAAAIEGRLEVIGGGGLTDLPLEGVGTDTRTDLSAKVFVALVGDSHDAHHFLLNAVEQKARALIVRRELTAEERAAIEIRAAQSGMGLAVIKVENTLTALQELSRHWRRKCRALFFGITGTNGKTSTKEFAAALIGSKLKVQWSKGSFNNHWGVPLSLLSVDPSHDVAVIEMGMNHLGELKLLSRLVEADVVVCTMVGRGHLEGVGSIDGVAKAKAEIYEFAPPLATFIFNLDNEYTLAMRDRFLQGEAGATRRSLSFSQNAGDVSLRVKSQTAQMLQVAGTIRGVDGEAAVPVFGAHNVTNLMAAAALALAAGLTPKEVWAGLPLCRSAWGRNQWVELSSGANCLFDGYNANPESMTAALENSRTLEVSGRRIAILAEMRELGEHASSCHEEIGRRAASCGFSEIWFFGPSAEHFRRGFSQASSGTSALETSESLDSKRIEILDQKYHRTLKPGDFVLIKGSRGMSLEKALAALGPKNFDTKKNG